MEIVNLAFNPRAPTPQEEQTEAEPSEIANSEAESEIPVVGVSSTGLSGSLSFIQASEIETPSFDDSVEWVEKSDAADEEPTVNGESTQGAEPSAAAEVRRY